MRGIRMRRVVAAIGFVFGTSACGSNTPLRSRQGMRATAMWEIWADPKRTAGLKLVTGQRSGHCDGAHDWIGNGANRFDRSSEPDRDAEGGV